MLLLLPLLLLLWHGLQERAEVSRLKRALAESTAAGEREYLDLEQQLAEAERSRAAACNRATELHAQLRAAGLAPASEKESGSEEEEGIAAAGSARTAAAAAAGGSGASETSETFDAAAAGAEAAVLRQQLQQLQGKLEQQGVELEQARQQQQVVAVPGDAAMPAAAMEKLQQKVQQVDMCWFYYAEAAIFSNSTACITAGCYPLALLRINLGLRLDCTSCFHLRACTLF
jgi:hypothetical protein